MNKVVTVLVENKVNTDIQDHLELKVAKEHQDLSPETVSTVSRYGIDY